MSVINIQVNGYIHKFFGSGDIPSSQFGDIVEFNVIAQKEKDSDYSFYLAKANLANQD